MKEKMDNLVQGLREELIQYGEMLTLLEAVSYTHLTLPTNREV